MTESGGFPKSLQEVGHRSAPHPFLVFVAAGYWRRGGLSTLDQGEEPVLLQTADEPRPLSPLLPGLPADDTPAGPHVPHWCFVAGRVHVAPVHVARTVRWNIMGAGLSCRTPPLLPPE